MIKVSSSIQARHENIACAATGCRITFIVTDKAYIEGYEEVDLNYVFPNQEKVFADWFTGEIRIPTGDMLKYVHTAYCSVF
jgi:hypothetical protein